MTVQGKFDKATIYLALAQEARKRAEAPAAQPFKKAWLELACSWEFLAQLQSDPCFCGQPSVGYKYFPNGEKRPVCGQHMRELIAEHTLIRLGLKKSH